MTQYVRKLKSSNIKNGQDWKPSPFADLDKLLQSHADALTKKSAIKSPVKNTSTHGNIGKCSLSSAKSGNGTGDNTKSVPRCAEYSETDTRLIESLGRIKKKNSLALDTVLRLEGTSYFEKGTTVVDYALLRKRERYDVISLSGSCSLLAARRIRALAFAGYELEALSWTDALAGVLAFMLKEHEGRFMLLDRADCLYWIRKKDRTKGIVASWQTGECSIRLQSFRDVCFWLQWVFLVCEVPLAEVGVLYDKFTDKEWLRYRQSRVFCRPWDTIIKPKKWSLIKNYKPTWVERERKAQDREKIFSENKFVEKDKTYILVNGVVEVVGVSSGDDRQDGNIARTENAADWNGYGFIARDQGRYGGIEGENYVD